tara:strand:- start:450 stop:707 length:258 start_codon:yes stop_codon:yes gene_type:complete
VRGGDDSCFRGLPDKSKKVITFERVNIVEELGFTGLNFKAEHMGFVQKESEVCEKAECENGLEASHWCNKYFTILNLKCSLGKET